MSNRVSNRISFSIKRGKVELLSEMKNQLFLFENEDAVPNMSCNSGSSYPSYPLLAGSSAELHSHDVL